MKIGCIGCGNMGGAIMTALAKAGKGYELYGYTRTRKRMDPLIALGVQPVENARQLVEKSDYIILAVKPYQVKEVLADLQALLSSDKTLLSIAAGVSLESLKEASGGKCSLIRAMPNTPALVGEGVIAFCFEESKQKETVFEIFSVLGSCFEVPESRFTAFTSLVGAGPAYLFDLMEGMVQAGVTLGFQHAEARRMVAGLFVGAGRMALLDEKSHLIALRDNVCSPAGTTIAGVNQMDADGLAGKLAQAVFAAQRRGKEMEN